MIAGHTKADLELYRIGLIDKRDIHRQPSQSGVLYGHHYFSMQEPDGNGITFYTNHCGDKPVYISAE